ncbi:MAG: hypothetical protein HUJ31_04885 [Pseudomonadales bacterium]|nr:hypothetical protein [Pseudomonadales bacterium]
MKLNIKAMAIAFGIVWGGVILIVGVANMISPDYGVAFLEMAASIYPGYEVTGSLGQVIVASLYGLVDGAIGGAVFAFLYNLFVPSNG